MEHDTQCNCCERVRELEARLMQYEHATCWLEESNPEIYEEWLEMYQK